MAEFEKDWLDWNPMAQHYFDDSSSKYETINEASTQGRGKQNRTAKQMQYPYLVIHKKNAFITETLLKNFFGDNIIYNIEYRNVSRVFAVYFHNIGSLEAAWTKIRQFPNILSCVKGRPKQNEQFYPRETNVAEETKMPEPAPTIGASLESRTIHVSKCENKHPEFFKPPIVIKAEYTSKNSLLGVNDASFRYLSVKYDFMLERRGAYVLQEIVEKDQAVLHYRSGRLIVTPKNESEIKGSVGTAQIAQLVKKCLACNCYTDNSCKFCQMPFCNLVCFDVLAAEHKDSCERGRPPLIDDTVVPQLTKMKLPPSGSSVKITAFEQSNVFYVRSAEIVAEVAYYKVLSDVMMGGKLAPKLIQLPQCGQIVIYKSAKQIVRAMVLNVDNPQAIYVVCLDYGSVEITELEYLHECSASLAALPRYALPVLLRGVPRRYMYPNLRDMLYELDHTYTFVLKYSEREFDFDKGMQRVILIETDMNRSLNRLIKTIVTPVEPSFSEVGYTENYLQHVHLPTGQGIDLVVMDNTFIKFGVIHCTILDYAYEITEMQRDMQIYGESIAKSTFFAPPKNDLCIAKYQGKWCRGLCMELVGDGYPSILFVDYGNIITIHVDDIHPYPPQFTFPILTTEYDLLGVPPDLNDEQLARLQKHLAVGAIIKWDEVIYNEMDNNYSLRLDAVQKLIE